MLRETGVSSKGKKATNIAPMRFSSQGLLPGCMMHQRLLETYYQFTRFEALDFLPRASVYLFSSTKPSLFVRLLILFLVAAAIARSEVFAEEVWIFHRHLGTLGESIMVENVDELAKITKNVSVLTNLRMGHVMYLDVSAQIRSKVSRSFLNSSGSGCGIGGPCAAEPYCGRRASS